MAGQPREVHVPVALVAPLRAALQGQGLSPFIVGDDGTINPAFFVSAAYDKAEFRSRAFAPLQVDLGAAIDPNAPVNPLVKFLKPTVILTGRAGTTVVAPFGEATPAEGWVGFVALVGGLVGLGYLIGRATA